MQQTELWGQNNPAEQLERDRLMTGHLEFLLSQMGWPKKFEEPLTKRQRRQFVLSLRAQLFPRGGEVAQVDWKAVLAIGLIESDIIFFNENRYSLEGLRFHLEHEQLLLMQSQPKSQAQKSA